MPDSGANRQTPRAWGAPANALALAVFLFAGIVCVRHLETSPPLFWDEGWTISLARNWIERGHYGQLLLGEPAPPGLAAQFPVVLPIAASFRVLGVGLWQARLPSVCFILGTLGLLYWLGRALFGPWGGTATLFAALLGPFPPVNILVIGRQAMAEVPMMFFLLAGYSAFMARTRFRAFGLVIAVLCWAMALVTKLQPLPFWSASLMVPLVLAVRTRDRALAWDLGLSLVGSFGLAQGLLRLWTLTTGVSAAPVPGLYQAIAFAPFSGSSRLLATVNMVLLGWSILVAVWYALRHRRQLSSELQVKPGRQTVAVALFVFVLTWSLWFLFFSVGWGRYLFPATLVASIFVGWVIVNAARLTRAIARRAERGIPHRAPMPIAALAVIGLVPFALKTLGSVVQENAAGLAVSRTAAYIAENTPLESIIETYDAELWVFLDRRYHYPPDAVHVDLNRQAFLGMPRSVSYDPLVSDPDYLVVGPQDKTWHLYDSVIAGRDFQFVHAEGAYSIYKRVR